MRKVVLVLAIVLAVAAAAILVGPNFVDWNQYKQPLISQVESATGRQVAIEGDLSLSLLPKPRLSASGVTLSNVDGATAAQMMRLDTARVSVAAGPLLQLRLEVESLELVGPRIELERLADGTTNWRFGATDTTADASPAGADGATGRRALPQVRFDDIRISDGTVIFRDAVAGTVERFEDINLSLVAGSLAGPFRAEGEITARGVPLDLRFALGQLFEDRGIPLSAGFAAEGLATTGEFAGVVSGFPAAVSVSGGLTIAAEDIATVIANFSAAPAAATGPLAVDADLSFTPGNLAFNDVDLDFAGTTASGTATVALAETPRIDVTLAAPRLDLDAMLAAPDAAPAEVAEPESPAQVVPGAQPAEGFSLPDAFAATVDLSADAVTYRGGVVRQVNLAGELVNGEFILNQASAQLPGGSDLSVFGFVAAVDGAPVFDGQIEASSDNVRGLLDWLGQDVAAIPADRLRKLDLAAKVRVAQPDLTVSGIDMRLDSSQIRGGVAVALRRRPGFGIGLSIDRINLDAYLPDPVTAAGPEDSADPPADAQDATADTPPETADQPPAPALAGLAFLDTFDAILQLQVGNLTVAGTQLNGIGFDGTLQGGALTLREAGIADAAGTSLRVQGGVTNLGAAPEVDVRLQAETANAGRLADTIAGFPRLPAQPASVTASLSGDVDNLTVSAVINAVSGEATVNGAVAGLAAAPTYQLDFGITHPSLAGLVAALSGRPTTVADPGRFSASATIAGDTAAANLDLSARLGDGALSVAGDVTNPLLGAAGTVDVDFSHPDLAALVRTFEPDYRPALAELGEFRLTAAARFDPERIAVSEAVGAAGPVALQGEASVDLTGARPVLDATLATSEIVLDWFLAPVAALGTGGDAAPAAPDPAPNANRDTRRWSREPINLAPVVGWDANIRLTAPAVGHGAFRVGDPELAASVEAGTLTLQQFSGEIFGGGFNLTGALAGAELPDLSLILSVSDADAAQLAEAIQNSRGGDGDIATGLMELLFPVSGVTLSQGRIGADLAIATAGRSEFELVSNLSGNGEVTFVDAVIDGVDVCAISDQLDRLSGLEGFLGLLAAGDGGTTTVPEFIGQFAVDRGIATIPPQQLAADCATAAISGTVDLPRWLVDLQARLSLPAHPEFPGVLVQERGALDGPDARLVNVNEIQQFLLARAATSVLRELVEPAPEAAPADSAEPEAEPETIDPFRNLLEGLIQ